MIDLKQYERKQIKDLLALLDTLFADHPDEAELRETLNLFNLSMRRLLEIMEAGPTPEESDAQMGLFRSKLVGYSAEHLGGGGLSRWIEGFLAMVADYYRYVDRSAEAMVDLCNVFRLVSEVYLRSERGDAARAREVRAGLAELVDDWLGGRVRPPSSGEEIPDEPAAPRPPKLGTVALEVASGVAWVRLNRPEVKNAMSRELIRDLAAAFAHLGRRADARLVALTGAGDAFCAGADLREMAKQDGQDKLEMARELGALLRAVDECPKPVLAVVNGPCMGGGMGLACAADLVLVEGGVVFSFPEVRLGIVPAMISHFVVRRLGPVRGRRLMLTGERFGADRALEWGLADEVHPRADLPAAVERWRRELAKVAPGAAAECKRLAREVSARGAESALEYAEGVFDRMLDSEEAREGMLAFAAKRKPRWEI